MPGEHCRILKIRNKMLVVKVVCVHFQEGTINAHCVGVYDALYLVWLVGLRKLSLRKQDVVVV